MNELQAEKLDRFMNSVNTEVDEKINLIIENAQSEKRRRVEKAENEALLEAYNRIQKSVKDTESRYRKEYALKQQQLRMNELKYRETLTENIFGVIREKVNSFISSDKYREYLLKLAADENAGGSCVIMVSKKDYHYKEIIEQSTGCLSLIHI